MPRIGLLFVAFTLERVSYMLSAYGLLDTKSSKEGPFSSTRISERWNTLSHIWFQTDLFHPSASSSSLFFFVIDFLVRVEQDLLLRIRLAVGVVYLFFHSLVQTFPV